MDTIRKHLQAGDLILIREILESSGFFYDFEIEVALETAVDNLDKGEESSGYSFRLFEKDGKPVAFMSFGKSPCTIDSYDLYWIAVHQDYRDLGIGKQLMRLLEEEVNDLGGGNIWIETSSRPLYEPTRNFYLNYGCEKVAELPHFYARQDHKVIFLKKI